MNRKMKKKSIKCYICNNAVTSDEHVPAECFFPKGRRSNLITVPSCNIHNQETSKDDEYVRAIITMAKGANNIAADHFYSKVLKSFERRPALKARIMKEPLYLNYIENNEATSGLTLNVERERFDKVMKKIAYGLHFHKYKETWEKELFISTEKQMTPSYETDILVPAIKEHGFKNSIKVFEGNHPEIFQFAFIEFLNRSEKVVFMKFYEDYEVWAFPVPSSTSAFI